MTPELGVPTPTPRGHVLIVDDEPGLLDFYADLLADAGYETDSAADGHSALERVQSQHYDAILTDINMPNMDGLTLLRAVRERDLDVPVIIMTGDPRLETAIQAVDCGALSYLLKPVGAEALIHSVGRAVQLSRIARLKRETLGYLGMTHRLLGDRAGLEAAFERALASIWMAYQPIVHAADTSLFAHEALVRTTEQTMPNPGALFDAAERLGRVPQVGWAVRNSVAALLHSGAQPRPVFVNLHTLDLLDDSLFSPSAELSRRAASVVLEITERASLEGVPEARSRIRRLKSMGYRIALDDFGAGYAGLSTFATLEPDIVKLDMALVRGLDHEPVKRRLVASIAALCRELGISVVAEGIETEAERSAVVDLGWDLLQGYLFGRPGPPGSA
jgi:EAL domain-containing protein (putative c-di-GMP-specific phosphodiesterase class I)/ActR/RegA family two-component response regulator